MLKETGRKEIVTDEGIEALQIDYVAPNGKVGSSIIDNRLLAIAKDREALITSELDGLEAHLMSLDA